MIAKARGRTQALFEEAPMAAGAGQPSRAAMLQHEEEEESAAAVALALAVPAVVVVG